MELPRDYTLISHWPDCSGMVAGIESECRPDSRRNGGRFPVGIVAGFSRNTQSKWLSYIKGLLKGAEAISCITPLNTRIARDYHIMGDSCFGTHIRHEMALQ